MCATLSFGHRNIKMKQHRQTVTVQPPIYWGTTRLPSLRPTELEPSIHSDVTKFGDCTKLESRHNFFKVHELAAKVFFGNFDKSLTKIFIFHRT